MNGFDAWWLDGRWLGSRGSEPRGLLRRLAPGVLIAALVLAGCPGDDGSAGGSSTSTSTTDTTTDSGSTSTTGSTGATDTTVQTGADSTTSDDPVPLPARLGVTADWLARTLTVIDLDALARGARTRDEIVARTIDLGAYAPGPLQVELEPDGVTAVVSISPGFYGGFVGNLIGAGDVEQDGTLLRVDLDSEAITEIPTTHVPMGIAIAPDGSRAYTANYGLDDPIGSTISVIDLTSDSVMEEIEVGQRPEQISLDDEGSLAIFNVVEFGGVRVFQTDDPSGTLSPPLVVGSDPSDVDFIPGTPYALVTNSLDPSNYVVIDVGDPMDPVEVSVGPPGLGAFYGATPIPGTNDVVLTSTDFVDVTVHRVTVEGDGSLSPQWEAPHPVASFLLGAAIDVTGGQILSGAPGMEANVLVVQALDGGRGRQIAWQDVPGPTYVAVAP